MTEFVTLIYDLTRKFASVNRLLTQRDLCENSSNHNNHVNFRTVLCDLTRKFASVFTSDGTQFARKNSSKHNNHLDFETTLRFDEKNFSKNSSNESNHVDFETLDFKRTHLGKKMHNNEEIIGQHLQLISMCYLLDLSAALTSHPPNQYYLE